MHKIIKKLRVTIRLILAAFFGSTILAVVALRFLPVYFTPLMFIRLAQQAGEGRELRLSHHWVPLNDISPYMPVAVIASEHAAKRNKQHPERRKLGASTISQQTAKNVFLWPGRSWMRKGFEVYFTTLIELLWSKERIMEVYLNSIEMGDGIYGASAVAEEHFGIRAKDLSRSQCALIAATLPNPRQFSSKHPSAYMQKRQARILKEMKYVKSWKSQD